MASTLLVGLYPPSNVERTLNEAKQRLFRTFASVSAIALGPVIPLCYEPMTTEPPEARTLPHGITLTTSRWMLVDGRLMLAVDPADRLEELSRSLGGKTGEGGSEARPVPVFAGAYMAFPGEAQAGTRWPDVGGEESFSGEDMLESLGSPPQIRWSVSEAVCWRLEISDPRRWWNDVKCQELWRVRLRKGDARRPKT